MRTSPFATTAPVWSCTVPVIAPVAPPCANTWLTTANTINGNHGRLRENLRIHSSPLRADSETAVQALEKNEGTTKHLHAPRVRVECPAVCIARRPHGVRKDSCAPTYRGRSDPRWQTGWVRS